MASIEDFVQSPSKDLLNSYKKDHLLKMADYFSAKLPKKLSKDGSLDTLKAQSVQRKVSSVLVDGASAPVGVTSFSDVASPTVKSLIHFLV